MELSKTNQLNEGFADLADLQDVLKYRFKNADWLKVALTHASAKSARKGARVNERLEFLGDRVLGLLAAETLFKRHPDDAEGLLAPRLNALVRKERCAAIAQEINLGRFLDLSGNPGLRRDQLPMAILGNACEALIGALYLDGGLETARAFFDTYWADAIDLVTELPRDAKSTLQEWAQNKSEVLPVYEMIGRTGPDHRPEFEISVSIGEGGVARGVGPSRRAAEQAAAAALLVALGAWTTADVARAEETGSLK